MESPKNFLLFSKGTFERVKSDVDSGNVPILAKLDILGDYKKAYV